MCQTPHRQPRQALCFVHVQPLREVVHFRLATFLTVVLETNFRYACSSYLAVSQKGQPHHREEHQPKPQQSVLGLQQLRQGHQLLWVLA